MYVPWMLRAHQEKERPECVDKDKAKCQLWDYQVLGVLSLTKRERESRVPVTRTKTDVSCRGSECWKYQVLCVLRIKSTTVLGALRVGSTE